MLQEGEGFSPKHRETQERFSATKFQLKTVRELREPLQCLGKNTSNQTNHSRKTQQHEICMILVSVSF